MKYGFVVLNFNNYEVTKKCVDSILGLYRGETIDVVIVDNGSANNSVEVLTSYYERESDVTIVISKNNEGYAKGNNLGYTWLKENREEDFIILCNSDVLFDQDNFLKIVASVHKKQEFDILGPNITNIDGTHINPLRRNPLSVDKIRKSILYEKLILFACQWKRLFHIYHNIYSKRIRENRTQKNANWRLPSQKCVLQGSCYILSRRFIGKNEYVFHPDTFLYFEEDILKLMADRKKEVMLYSPQLHVLHIGAQSSAYTSDERKKVFWMTKETIKSKKIYLRLYKEYWPEVKLHE